MIGILLYFLFIKQNREDIAVLLRETPIVLVGMIVYLIATIIVYITTRKRMQKINWIHEGIKGIFVIYIMMVVAVTMFPLAIGNTLTKEALFHSINLIPLVSIFSEISQIVTVYGGDSIFMIKLIIKNVGGNILLLMPLGFLAPILWEKYRKLKRVLLLGFLVSISIECLQFVELVLGIAFGRKVDIDKRKVDSTFVFTCIHTK
jgi:glycopeptide antibiotics resistance protein